MDILGATLFVILALVRMPATLEQANPAMLMLVLQSGLAAFWLIYRKSASASSPWYTQVLAWLSALLPLAMQMEHQSVWWLAWLPAPGLILNLWALSSLGNSFSIAPADRGLAFAGPYRRIRHPMYAGELLSLFPVMLTNMSVWNVLMFGLFALAIIWRIRREETLLSRYEIYAQFVRWKLLPGIW